MEMYDLFMAYDLSVWLAGVILLLPLVSSDWHGPQSSDSTNVEKLDVSNAAFTSLHSSKVH